MAAPKKSGQPRLTPVSTDTAALMPVRNAISASLLSSFRRTGMRCVTFTQFPVAFWAGSRANVERLANEASAHGWKLLFGDRHPFAGGPDHFAAFLENSEGFEVELVADDSGE